MPDDGEVLWQGDLIGDLPFPSLKNELRPVGQQLVLDVDMRPALVVSQSCTIQNQHVVAVAPLRLVAVKDPSYEVILRNMGPGRSETNPQAKRYIFNFFALQSHPHLPRESDGEVRVADLAGIVTLSGDTRWLAELRLGRMTVEGRRALRYNLATFWGRVTAADAATLAAADLSPEII